jgi:hypothetical protein
VQVADKYYTAEVQALVLTHASATDAFLLVQFRSEVNTSTITVKEGSFCKAYVLHVDS